MLIPILLALLLALAALILLRWSRGLYSASGLPQGKLIYDDTGVREELEQPLLSRRYGLAGRPDYLVRSPASAEVIPVEVKSSRTPEAPYESHILQLGAYCLLVEDHFGTRPTHGLLRYADATFKIPFTDELRYRVLDAAAAVREARRAEDVARSHDDPARCRACGYRRDCSESLV